jgi:hypothetical protein
MDAVGIWFAIPLIVLPLFFLPAVWRSKGSDRLFGFICAGSAMALGVVKILFRTGRMEEGPAYWTLNIALSTMFFVTLLLAMYLSRKRQKNAIS